MRLNQQVKWKSHGGCYSVEKAGKIVRVLNEDDNPIEVAKRVFPDHKRMFDGLNLPGMAETAYLVEVIPSPRAKRRLYMPYPSKLEAVKTDNAR